jgi:phosphoribosylanthranilate isomerase
VFVKICGITNEEDALLAVAVGADAVGFVFAPSTRQIAPTRVAEIVRRLPADVITVGVFRNELPARVVAIVNQAGLHAAQLHGDETPEMVAEVRRNVRTVFKAVAAGSEAFAHADAFGADAVLVDAATPGSGQVFDWRLAEDAPHSVRLIMAGGLTPDNVADAVTKVRPWGVDVSSGVERSPGVKDPVLVRTFVRNARNAGALIGAEGFGGFDAGGATARSRHLDIPTSARDLGPEPYDWQEDATWR